MDTVEKRIGAASFISEIINVRNFRKSFEEEMERLNSLLSPVVSVDGTANGGGENSPKERLNCHQIQMSDISIERKIKKTMGIESDMLQSLQLDCASSSLNGEKEPPIEILTKRSCQRLLNRVPSRANLKTLDLQREDLKERSSDNSFRKNVNWFLRAQTKVDFPAVSGFSKHQTGKGDLENDQIIFVVQVFRPAKHDIHLNFSKSKKTVRNLEQELAILGSQKLSDLRDNITCLSDETIPCELSDHPNNPPDQTSREVYKSSFFYINGTFYNDERHPENKDYSMVIRKWASEDPSLNLGPFKTDKMEEKSFLDLEIKLGYPYLYQHQGDCEHVIVFSDLRMVHPEDCRFVSAFPLATRYLAKKRVACMLCNTATANWITYGNDRVWDQPFYFCNACFHSFNYTTENQKIGNFKAYHYIDRNAL